jgi:ribonucleotide monophosphatase NagD (HAD superfamily)
VRLGDIPETSLPELIERHDVLLLDAYGVLMETAGALPGAAAALAAIRDSGAGFAVLTNDASRLPETTSERFGEMGLDVPADRIVTSGSILARYFEEQRFVGARCAVLGPEDSFEYVARAGGQPVPLSWEPDVIALCDEDGYDMLATLDELISVLFRRIDAGDPPALVLPNPDLIYPKGKGEYGLTAGALAELVETALRQRYPGRQDLSFARLGKPHRPIFDEVLDGVGDGRAVMIGDQLGTDIRGARDAGLDSVLVGTGLTPWRDDLELGDVVPTHRMAAFRPTGS